MYAVSSHRGDPYKARPQDMPFVDQAEVANSAFIRRWGGNAQPPKRFRQRVGARAAMGWGQAKEAIRRSYRISTMSPSRPHFPANATMRSNSSSG
jgi:hypothetical protein